MVPILNSIYYSAPRPVVEAIEDDLFPVNGYEAACLDRAGGLGRSRRPSTSNDANSCDSLACSTGLQWLSRIAV